MENGVDSGILKLWPNLIRLRNLIAFIPRDVPISIDLPFLQWTFLITLLSTAIVYFFNNVVMKTKMKTRITSKKIPCYMPGSACRWHKTFKYFEIVWNHFQFLWPLRANLYLPALTYCVFIVKHFNFYLSRNITVAKTNHCFEH